MVRQRTVVLCKVGYVWRQVYLGAGATTTNNSYRMVRSDHQCILPIDTAELAALAALAQAVTGQAVELAWVDRNSRLHLRRGLCGKECENVAIEIVCALDDRDVADTRIDDMSRVDDVGRQMCPIHWRNQRIQVAMDDERWRRNAMQ